MFIAIVNEEFIKEIQFNQAGEIVEVSFTTNRDEFKEISVDEYESYKKSLDNYFTDGSCKLISIATCSEDDTKYIIDTGTFTWDEFPDDNKK
ncbi:hypothetical protein [Bacillus thuringiensis]|uniref:Uncharacterized protein n=1 Tax=Bacillus thuringiensis TaxID=1428 RepID=A0A9X6ZR17_BACTU|nr:hypothetical protein [Bacillus thuringiensis]PFJ33156.1 hypothetical protein COJ15_28350 [Bacillus thuringiensis]